MRRVFYAVIYSAILFSVGCRCQTCHEMQKRQERVIRHSQWYLPAEKDK